MAKRPTRFLSLLALMVPLTVAASGLRLLTAGGSGAGAESVLLKSSKGKSAGGWYPDLYLSITNIVSYTNTFDM